jgi:hypothetical protein
LIMPAPFSFIRCYKTYTSVNIAHCQDDCSHDEKIPRTDRCRGSSVLSLVVLVEQEHPAVTAGCSSGPGRVSPYPQCTQAGT